MGEKDRQQPFLPVQFVQVAFASFLDFLIAGFLSYFSPGNAWGLSCQLRE